MHLRLAAIGSLCCLAVGAAELNHAGAEFHQQSGRYYFRAVNSDLSQALAILSKQSGLAIHYSLLPDARVSATCASASLSELLKCVLDGKVDVAFRYPDAANNGEPLEAWLLGSRISVTDASCNAESTHQNTGLASAASASEGGDEPSAEQKLAFRKELAVSGTPEQKAQAFSYLASHASLEDGEVRQIFESALTDVDSEVKSQALAALVRWQGEQQSLPELQAALMDPDVTVRLMAMQHIDQSRVLLEPMLSDPDDLVRQFAAGKLQN